MHIIKQENNILATFENKTLKIFKIQYKTA